MTQVEHVVVVGAGLGGLRTVENLRRRKFAGRITLVGAERREPYDRPPLTKAVLRGQLDDTTLNRNLAALELDLRLGRRAVTLDATGRAVELDSGEAIGYDALVLAPGAVPRLPGDVVVRPGVHVIRTAEDSLRLREALTTSAAIVVVGGGFIGCEVAASARELGVDVDLVELLAMPLVRALGRDAAQLVVDLHTAHGVRLHNSRKVVDVLGADSVSGVELDDGTVIASEHVVFGLGVTPDVAWLASSGIELGDGIRCDAQGRTSLPGVYAVGDAAEWWQPLADRHRRIEHWTNAMEQAMSVAATIGGDGPGPPPGVPYVWSDQYDAKIQALGFVDADDDVTVCDADGRPVLLYARDGVLRAAVGISATRAVMSMRAMIQNRAPVADAISKLAG